MSGNLLRNLLLFGRVLRGLGLDVNPGRMIDLVAALQFISIGSRSDFYHAARSLLVHRREDIASFDDAFEFFWRSRGRELTSLDVRTLGERRRYRRPQIVPPPLKEATEVAGEGPEQPSQRPPVLQATLTYSEREVLRQKDFSELTGEEIEAVKVLMAEIVWRVRQRQTARRRPGRGRLLVTFCRIVPGSRDDGLHQLVDAVGPAVGQNIFDGSCHRTPRIGLDRT